MRVAYTITGAVVAGLVLAAGVAFASDQPDYRYHYRDSISNVVVETDSCPGFAVTDPLLFAGTIIAAYSVWNDPSGSPPEIQEGYSQIKVAATDGTHTYRIHQRYEYPRAPREYTYGFATTVVRRDDGATMAGTSWLGIDPFKTVPGVPGAPLGVWIDAPTCTSGK